MVNQALLDEYWLIFDRYARSIIKYIDYEAYYLANQEVFARDVYISKHFAYTKQLQDITIY